jgi:WD40 repeat protein
MCLLDGLGVRCGAQEAVSARADFDHLERPLPPGALARLGSLRLREEFEVRAISFSPDGKKIASVSDREQSIQVWDAATGKLLHRIATPRIFSREFGAPEDHTVAFAPDGKSIAAGVGGDVVFWNLQSGQEVRRFRGRCKGILALTFTSDQKTFYCGGADNKLYQWDITSGQLLKCWDYFEGNQPMRYASGFTAKTATLKAISRDGKTAVWHISNWADTGTGVGMERGKLVVWDVDAHTDRCRITDREHKDFFHADVALSMDGKLLTAQTRNGSLTLWETATGKKVTLNERGGLTAVAYSPDCRRVAAFTGGGTDALSIWDIATGKLIWQREISSGYAHTWHHVLAFAPDGKALALGIWKNVLIVDSESGKDLTPLSGHRWPVHALEFARSGVLGATLISTDTTCICEWNAAHHQTSRHALLPFRGASRSVAECYHARLRLHQPEGRPLQLRDLIKDEVLREFPEIPHRYYHGCFSRDGNTVALFWADKTAEITILDIASRRVRSRFTPEAPYGTTLVLSQDGRILAAPCSDQTVSLIDTFTGKTIRRLGTPQPVPGSAEDRMEFTTGAFATDGRLVAFGTWLHRHDDDWKLRHGQFDDLAPDPPGIRVWDVATGREQLQFTDCLHQAPRGHIISLHFSPDNHSLAVGLHYNPSTLGDAHQAAVPVVETVSGKLRRRFLGHTGQVGTVAFSPDGALLATAGMDTSILVWDMARPFGTAPTVKLAIAERLQHYWNQLAGLDGVAAYDAVISLAERPNESIALFAKRMKPVAQPSKEELAQWVADLDADLYPVREAASRKLAAVHELALPALTKALAGEVSLEARRRMLALVEPLDTMKYSGPTLQQLRAVEVLERIANRDSRCLLEALAGGAADSSVTIAAISSLARLNGHSSNTAAPWLKSGTW